MHSLQVNMCTYAYVNLKPSTHVHAPTLACITNKRTIHVTPCPPITDHTHGPVTQSAINILQLQHQAQQFLTLGLASATRATYSAGWRKFRSFCTETHTTSMPASEHTLLLFATSMAASHISHGTIKVYLSAVRHMHVMSGLHEHFSQQLTPRLQLTLIGIKRNQAAMSPPRTRLPITLQLLHNIKCLLSQQPSCYDNIMLWAMCCLAFFGFLRVSEFTVPTQGDYDESTHLSLKDISIDSRSNPRLIKVHIKQSKTDPFRQGVGIYLGATDSPICPVSGILPYLAVRGTQPGPLFITNDGKYLTRLSFSKRINVLLESLQVDTSLYNTHSFRIGAATTAAQAHIPEAHIKMLGRWRSDAYHRYIKTPPQELAQLTKRLVSATPLGPEATNTPAT